MIDPNLNVDIKGSRVLPKTQINNNYKNSKNIPSIKVNTPKIEIKSGNTKIKGKQPEVDIKGEKDIKTINISQNEIAEIIVPLLRVIVGLGFIILSLPKSKYKDKPTHNVARIAIMTFNLFFISSSFL